MNESLRKSSTIVFEKLDLNFIFDRNFSFVLKYHKTVAIPTNCTFPNEGNINKSQPRYYLRAILGFTDIITITNIITIFRKKFYVEKSDTVTWN